MRDKLRDKVRKHFEAGEIAEGFACLEALDAEAFFGFLFKNNKWITEGTVSAYFWTSYLPASPYFDAVMSGEQAINLLHHYFSKNADTSEALLHRLAAHYPQLLVRTIRLNRAFVNVNHDLSLVFLKDSADEYLKYHYYVFYELSVKHYRLYNTFSRAVYALAPCYLTDVMYHAALWLEEKRFATLNPDALATYDLQHATESIGLFFDHYGKVHAQVLSVYEYTDQKGKESQEKVLSECLRAYENKTLHEQAVWHCLDAAADYWHFTAGIFNAYCFDLNYEVVREGEELLLVPQSMSLYHAWHREGTKLEYWQEHYRNLCEGMIPYPAHDNTKDRIQREAEIRVNMAFAVAEHFSLLNSTARSIRTKDLIRILNGFNSNAFGRFVYPLDGRYLQKPANWLLAVKEVLETGEAATLARFMGPDDFEALFRELAEFSFSKEAQEDVVQLLSTDLLEAPRYNRFRPFVNLFGKPFVNVNGTCMAFDGIMGESNMMGSVLINLLDKNHVWRAKVQKKETERMEERLAGLFKEVGFKQVVFGKLYDEKNFGVDGDLDVVIYEDGVMLCLELKRGKFRVLLDEIWDELRMGILTASLQLDKAERLLKNNLPKLREGLLKDLAIDRDDVSQIRFYSFIVATSFENDHRLIRDRHLKISLFELEEILKAYRSGKRKPSLEALIMEISRDMFWESRLGSFREKTKEQATQRFEIGRLQVHYF